MQYSIPLAILFASVFDIAACIPLTIRQVALQDIDTAQSNWDADTGIVSSFLSTAESLDQADLTAQAGIALAAEKDELNWKAVLDSQFVFVSNPDSAVQVANAVLVDQVTFQIVVNGLQNLADNGATMTPDEVTTAVQSINQDRCTFVLPAIDQYFIAAGNLIDNGNILTAVRPTNCP
jgi:hypothetical protein